MKAKDTFFQSWTKNMVLYGLDAGLGQFFMNAPETSCLYQLGNFIFPAGQVDCYFWQDFSKKYSLADKVIISEERSWQEFLDSQSELQQFTRYAFVDRADFDAEVLEKWQRRLPANYHLCPIDKENYERLAEEVWSQDLQGDFSFFMALKHGFEFLPLFSRRTARDDGQIASCRAQIAGSAFLNDDIAIRFGAMEIDSCPAADGCRQRGWGQKV